MLGMLIQTKRRAGRPCLPGLTLPSYYFRLLRRQQPLVGVVRADPVPVQHFRFDGIA